METYLSVIIGVYNCERTVLESLKSVANQTYKNFICYVCDDGSTDKTPQIVKDFCLMDNRFNFIKNEKNSGLSFTLNKCLRQCKTPLIARMDGDDICEPQRFEKQILFLDTHPEFSICGTSITYFDNNGSWGELIYPEFPEKKDFLSTNPFAHPTVIYRKSVIDALTDEYGNLYSENKKIGRSEDYDLFMRFYINGYKGYNLQEKLLNYREDRDAFSKRKFKYSITEARVRKNGFKKLGLMPKAFPFVLKPIIVGIIPKKIRLYLHQRKFKLEK